MKFIIMSIISICTLLSCAKNEIEESNFPTEKPTVPSLQEKSVITFNIKTSSIIEKEEKELTTKNVALLDYFEPKIYNYNIYCYRPATGAMKRIYVNSESPTNFTLMNGEWEIFAFANTDNDMGEMSYNMLNDYNYTISQSTDLVKGYRLFMYHRSTVYITGDRNLSLDMERLIAKFKVHFNLEGEAKNYKILKTEVFNCAAECKMFGTNPQASKTVSFENHKNGTMYFYVLENLQGVNNGIRNAKDKNYKTAPDKATFIRLTVESDTHTISYDYYLGENTTTDFNVRRNTYYKIEVNITGSSTSDWRISSTLLSKSMNVDSRFLEVYGYAHNKNTYDSWIFTFKAGNKKEIKLDLFADVDENEHLTTYISLLLEEEHYQEFVNTEELNEEYILLRSKKGSVCILFNIDEGEDGAGQRYATAIVKPDTKYRLVVLCHQVSGQPASINNDIRVYMEKDTEMEICKDFHFSVYP